MSKPSLDIEITELQKKTAQAIVNIFETGKPRGDYGKVTLIAGDPGHLTYGRSQTTLASGNLHRLIKAYCETEGAAHAAGLRPYLTRLAGRDSTLDRSTALRRLLKEAGKDPVMHDTQDDFFDRVYWRPSIISARNSRLRTGLGTTVAYDSRIHGSWNLMRNRTNANHGSAEELGEQIWVMKYIDTRRQWLAGHANVLLRKTVYRMDCLASLVSEAKWNLELPLTVRDVVLTAELLTRVPILVPAETEEYRVHRPNLRP